MTSRWHARNGQWRQGSTPVVPVDHKPVMGASTPPPNDETWADLESLLGQAMLVRRTFTGGFASTFPSTVANSDVAAGRWTVFSAKPDLSSLASGGLDSAYQTFIDSIPDGHKTTLIAWHEPEDQIANGTFSQRTWIDAQVRLGNLIRDAGRPELTFGVCLMGWTIDPRSGRNADSYFPANLSAVLDYQVWDTYNNYQPGGNWQWWDQSAQPPRMLDLARNRGHRIMFGEYGSSEHSDPTRKPEWMAQVYQWACDNDEVDALMYFHNTQGGAGDPGQESRPLDSSPAVTAEFAAEVEDSKS